MIRKTIIIVMAVCMVATIAASTQARKADFVKGAITYYKPSGHDAATHHGDSLPTFKNGVWLKLVNGNKSYPVHVTDVCDGSSCKMLDVTEDAFRKLGISTSQGVGKVVAYCGKQGDLPMRKCLAGEG